MRLQTKRGKMKREMRGMRRWIRGAHGTHSASYAGWLLACMFAAACNEPDVIARPDVVSGSGADAGLDCSLAAQLNRHSLPGGVGNLFLPDCEWPITQTDSVDGLRLLVGPIGVRSDTKAHLCALDQYHVWQEPPPPSPPQKLVFCPASCQLMRDWLACRLRDDPCRAQLEEDDAGVDLCQWGAAPPGLPR
jgi:hypothetical protein